MFKDDAGGKQIVEFVGWELNFTLTKCSMVLKKKNVRGWQRMLQKGVFKSMTIESACSTGRNNIEKWMSYEVIVMRFIQKKINKIALFSDDDTRVIMADEIHTLAYGHTNLNMLI